MEDISVRQSPWREYPAHSHTGAGLPVGSKDGIEYSSHIPLQLVSRSPHGLGDAPDWVSTCMKVMLAVRYTGLEGPYGHRGAIAIKDHLA